MAFLSILLPGFPLLGCNSSNGRHHWRTIHIYIFIQVRKRPLNKKETAKKEDDIITVSNNSLTVHEIKLKVRVCATLKDNMTSMIQFNEMKGHRPSSFYVSFSDIE